MVDVTDIKGIGPARASDLAEAGYDSVEDIADADPEELSDSTGVTDDKALDFVVQASNLVEDDSENEETSEGEEFDLTPAEVGEELEDITEEEDDGPDAAPTESEDEEESDEEAEEVEEEPYLIEFDFDNKFQYDVFHAAIMRHHERVYTSHQPASNAMARFLNGLDSMESASYEVTEFELNTLHTAVKQARTNYQGDNLIDHMDALKEVEVKIDELRREKLF